MKAKRQALIREIVESQSIQTQEELAEALRTHGMVVTQATVSRDIKKMEIIAMRQSIRTIRAWATGSSACLPIRWWISTGQTI